MLAKILNMSSGRCWSSDTYNPCPGVFENVPSSNNYDGGFGTALMTKVEPVFVERERKRDREERERRERMLCAKVIELWYLIDFISGKFVKIDTIYKSLFLDQ